MDESLILSAVDLSGEEGDFTASSAFRLKKVGDFDAELCGEFFIALANNGGMTLHIRKITGANSHHIIEGAFKASARALKEAVSLDEKFLNEIPSTKGLL